MWFAIAFSLLALATLLLLGKVFLDDARVRAFGSEQENKRNQEAILRLLNEMGDLADGDELRDIDRDQGSKDSHRFDPPAQHTTGGPAPDRRADLHRRPGIHRIHSSYNYDEIPRTPIRPRVRPARPEPWERRSAGARDQVPPRQGVH